MQRMKTTLVQCKYGQSLTISRKHRTKSLNGLVPEYLSDLFEKNSTRNVRKLRNTDTDLSLPLRKTNYGKRAISFRGPKLWNQLEPVAKQAPSLATFKRRIKNEP